MGRVLAALTCIHHRFAVSSDHDADSSTSTAPACLGTRVPRATYEWQRRSRYSLETVLAKLHSQGALKPTNIEYSTAIIRSFARSCLCLPLQLRWHRAWERRGRFGLYIHLLGDEALLGACSSKRSDLKEVWSSTGSNMRRQRIPFRLKLARLAHGFRA